jgi:hypothetical protein
MVKVFRPTAAALMLLIVAGCAQNPSAPKFNDAAGLQAEYHQETARLRLPPGYAFPARAPGGGADRFEAGVGESTADFYWMCAWIDRWLTTQSFDVPAANEALRTLDSANELPVWPHWDDIGRHALRGAVAAARTGERDGMERLTQGLGCAGLAH